MLREFQTILNKPVNGMYKASEAMVTGMGVVKDEANTEVGFPESATASDIFVVDKEKVATGYKAGLELSDYDEAYTNVTEGELVKLKKYHEGESFGTDQYKEGLTEGDAVAVGTDGKWVKATMASRYIFKKEYDDNGHTLAKIEVSDTAKTNA